METHRRTEKTRTPRKTDKRSREKTPRRKRADREVQRKPYRAEKRIDEEKALLEKRQAELKKLEQEISQRIKLDAYREKREEELESSGLKTSAEQAVAAKFRQERRIMEIERWRLVDEAKKIENRWAELRMEEKKRSEAENAPAEEQKKT